jgi:hypothetical protein
LGNDLALADWDDAASADIDRTVALRIVLLIAFIRPTTYWFRHGDIVGFDRVWKPTSRHITNHRAV